MEKAISTLNQLPSTRSQIKIFTAKLKEEILSGNEDVLKFAVMLKSMEEMIENLRKDAEITMNCLAEANKYPKGVFEVHGAKIQVRESGVKYDYSVCNDSVLNELNKKLKDLTEEKKKRENTLKNISGSLANPDTGEELYPPVKTSSTGIVVTLI
jgi:hypothetical protein